MVPAVMCPAVFHEFLWHLWAEPRTAGILLRGKRKSLAPTRGSICDVEEALQELFLFASSIKLRLRRRW